MNQEKMVIDDEYVDENEMLDNDYLLNDNEDNISE
jgi:hypothetical protein